VKLPIACFDCGVENEVYSYVEISDDNVLRAKCPSGHEGAAAMQNPRFELLFESGAYALVDGYTREAASSFAVALERFYEYWVQCTLLDGGASPECVRTFWKEVAKQSERQLGAFLCASTWREADRQGRCWKSNGRSSGTR
jgi:hypothetical protein